MLLEDSEWNIEKGKIYRIELREYVLCILTDLRYISSIYVRYAAAWMEGGT